MIDGVVPLKWLRRTLERALKVIVDPPAPPPMVPSPAEPLPDVPAWESVIASRRPDRPGVGHLLRHGATERVLLSGTGQGDAATTLLALARFQGQPAVVLGQQRRGRRDGRAGRAAGGAPRDGAGGRAAVTSRRGDRHRGTGAVGRGGRGGPRRRDRAVSGRSGHPADADGVGASRPGQRRPGAGDGARGRVLAALHGWLAPLPPEGASAIVCRDTAHAPELAAAQGIRSADLLASGIVDVIVPEYPDAADEPIDFTKRLSRAIATEVAALRQLPERGALCRPVDALSPDRAVLIAAVTTGAVAAAEGGDCGYPPLRWGTTVDTSAAADWAARAAAEADRTRRPDRSSRTGAVATVGAA